MKKNFRSIIGCALAVFAAGMMSSCSERIEVQDDAVGRKTCAMTLEGGVVGFGQDNGQTATKSVSAEWKEGDKLYLIFYNGTEKVIGDATYSATDGWSVTYDGYLSNANGLKCEVRHFADAPFLGVALVSLDSGTAVYEDLDGTYEFNGTSLSVQASMTPKTGRIRFSGKQGEKIRLTGIYVYSTYSPAQNKFSGSNSMFEVTVGSDGYTPYIYGSLSDSKRKLGLIGSDYAFTRYCQEAVLKVGDSGYMSIPTATSYNNWRRGLYVAVGDVEFKMIPVAGYSAGFFMMGETEVTNALYDKVTGSTSNSSKPDYPVTDITYDTFNSFIASLNNLTGLKFALPSKNQWQYAAKGGEMSQGFTYAGSNNPDDVAWYSLNSGYSKHPVKQLAPNELGLYDMSGNVSEYTATKYDSYYDYSYYFCGGDYSSPASAVTTNIANSIFRNDYDSYTSSASNGFRLIMTCN